MYGGKLLIMMLLVFILGLAIGVIIALLTQLKGVYFKKMHSLPPDPDLFNYKKTSEAEKYINEPKGTGNNSENKFNKEVY